MKVNIYHEKQESLLCGQHCLNNLLQAPIFTAVNLAEIANEMDQKEREILGGNSLSKDSANVDDSGNFSVQVLRTALQRFNNYDLEPWFVHNNGEVDIDPLEQQGFIINRSSHWFSIRKIVNNWWNLNSTSEKPELISQFYLSAFLHQLRADGYSVFIIKGAKLPAHGERDDEAYLPEGGEWYSEDALLGKDKKELSSANPFSGTGHRLGGETIAQPPVGGSEWDSRDFHVAGEEEDDEEMMLAKAISASLEQQHSSSQQGTVATPALSEKDLARAKRLAALEKRGL